MRVFKPGTPRVTSSKSTINVSQPKSLSSIIVWELFCHCTFVSILSELTDAIVYHTAGSTASTRCPPYHVPYVITYIVRDDYFKNKMLPESAPQQISLLKFKAIWSSLIYSLCWMWSSNIYSGAVLLGQCHGKWIFMMNAVWWSRLSCTLQPVLIEVPPN